MSSNALLGYELIFSWYPFASLFGILSTGLYVFLCSIHYVFLFSIHYYGKQKNWD